MTDIEQQIAALLAQRQQIVANATSPDAPPVEIINDQLDVIDKTLATLQQP